MARLLEMSGLAPEALSSERARTSAAATAPTTMVAGLATRRCRRPARSVRSTCWRGVVAALMTATGVLEAIPPARKRSAICSVRAAPIRITSVVPAWARASQLSHRSDDGSWWAVTTVKPLETPRRVTGMPAAAGAATAEVTPGTTSVSTPAARSAEASSPPRPNTNGSPPLSRTTCSKRRPRSMRMALISSWEGLGAPGVFPTQMSSAHGGASSITAGSTSRS